MIRAVVVDEEPGANFNRLARSENARRRPRCGCGAFEHPNKPCPPMRGPEPQPIAELIARAVRVEPDGCHSFNGLRTRNPQVKAKIPVRRYLMGLKRGEPKQVRHTCGRAWCINRDHLRVVVKRTSGS